MDGTTHFVGSGVKHLSLSLADRREYGATETVVGAGNVGGTTAQRLAERRLRRGGGHRRRRAAGKALDISQAGPVCGYGTVVGTNSYVETADLPLR
jgi:hypothetical protein